MLLLGRTTMPDQTANWTVLATSGLTVILLLSSKFVGCRKVTQNGGNTVADGVGIRDRVVQRLQGLLTTEGFHGIDRGGAAGGEKAGDSGCGEEQQGGVEEDQRVARADFGPVRHKLCGVEAEEYASRHAAADACGCRGEDQPEHVSLLGPQGDADAEFVGSLGYAI